MPRNNLPPGQASGLPRAKTTTFAAEIADKAPAKNHSQALPEVQPKPRPKSQTRNQTQEPPPPPENNREDGGPVINSRSSSNSTGKLAAERKEAAARLTLPPPKESPPALALDEGQIVIKSSTRRPSSASTGSSRKNGSQLNGKRPAASQGRTDFHHTDRLPGLSPDARNEISGIVLIVAGLILFFGMFAESGFIAGVANFIRQIFGIGAFIIPPLIVAMGATYIWEGLSNRERFNQSRVTGLIFMVVAFTSMVHLLAGNPENLAKSGGGGGYFAYYINRLLGGLITGVGAGLLWLAFFLIGLMLVFSMTLRDMSFNLRNLWRWLRGQPAHRSDRLDGDYYGEQDDWLDPPARAGKRTSAGASDDEFLDDMLLNGSPSGRGRKGPLVEEVPQYTHSISLSGDQDEDVIDSLPLAEGPVIPPATITAKGARSAQPAVKSNVKLETAPEAPATEVPNREWQVPSVNVLASFSDVEVNPLELRKKARQIENTLASFGVEAYVREVNTGPTVTQYALEPGIGVKVSRITALANDLALSLAAPTIRLEAPVPGQSRVGIEVPNTKVAMVGLREIMEAEDYNKRPGRLKFGLGRDVSGQAIITDLAKMPHLLIAGSTGSGKSVCLNSIVAAYLLQYRPTELQFIMIDPKMVELSTYNGIPHLRFPVVTQIESDPEKERNSSDRTPTVMSVLKWTIREMERRYKLLSLYGHRNIESFNKGAGQDNDLEKLSYLVLIVDELADLMMVAPEEAESAICRLAQKARAVGIHLILATQRPSVDVVTGLIKANFPSRITFAVTSQIDSRVILDMAGAEKLLGRGDMLYLASDAAKPMRVQGVYVSDEEIDMLVKHWRQQNDFLKGDKSDFVQPQLWPKDLQAIEAEKDTDETDELFEQALELVRETRTASTSLLQRRLRVGYNRAARLIEELAAAGVIGQADGSRPRTVLLAEEDLAQPGSLTAAASAFTPLPPAQLMPDLNNQPPILAPATIAPVKATPLAESRQSSDGLTGLDEDPPI